MIRSMTGFGREQAVINGREIIAEIRSVNHKFFEFSSKLPRNYQTWIFQYYTGIGVVTYKRICTEKIPDRAKYLINTRNVENFNRIMAERRK